MKIVSVLLASLLLAFSFTTVAQSQARLIRISDDPGGLVSAFIRKYEIIKALGERVEIDGECVSACTLITGILPRDRVCVTPRAALGFHMASVPDPITGELVPNEEGTEAIERIYPPYIMAWINRHGGLHSLTVKYMRGRDLDNFYHLCPIIEASN